MLCDTFIIAFTEIYCTCPNCLFPPIDCGLYEDSDCVINDLYTLQGWDHVRSQQTCGE